MKEEPPGGDGDRLGSALSPFPLLAAVGAAAGAGAALGGTPAGRAAAEGGCRPRPSALLGSSPRGVRGFLFHFTLFPGVVGSVANSEMVKEEARTALFGVL